MDKKNQSLSIQGPLQKARYHVPKTHRHILLRVLAWIFRERLSPLLKRLLIFQPRGASGPAFERTVFFSEVGVTIKDHIKAFPGARVQPGPRQNTRHVASADSFHAEECSPLLVASEGQSLVRDFSFETHWNENNKV